MGCAASIPETARETTRTPAVAPRRLESRRLEEAHETTRRMRVGRRQTTYEGRELATGRRVVIKETLDVGRGGDGSRRAEALDELEAAAGLSHPNVVRRVDAFRTSSEIYAVFEYVDGMVLLEYLKSLEAAPDVDEREKDDVKRELMRQMANAVAHAHASDVVLRDLRLNSFMVSHAGENLCADVTLKLTKLNRAKKLTHGNETLRLKHPVGVAAYQAPEVEERGEYSKASDMWSVGVILYFLCSGRLAFENSVSGVFQILRAEFRELDDFVDDGARALVADLLRLNPAKRMNAAQTAAHPYLMKKARKSGESGGLQVPNHVVRETRRQLAALSMQVSFEELISNLLAESLFPEEVKVLKRWLCMQTEVSVRRGRVYKVSYNLHSSGPSRSSSSVTGNPRKSLRDGDASTPSYSVPSHLYNDLNCGDFPRDGSFLSRQPSLERQRSLNSLTEAFESYNIPAGVRERDYKKAVETKRQNSPGTPAVTPSLDADISTWASDSSSSLSDFYSEASTRSFMGIAHDRGLVSMEELISVCYVASLTTVADELRNLCTTLKLERHTTLSELGIVCASQDKSLFEVMLFRHTDVLAKVETIQMDRAKSIAGAVDSVHGVFNGTVASDVSDSPTSVLEISKSVSVPKKPPLGRHGTESLDSLSRGKSGDLRSFNLLI